MKTFKINDTNIRSGNSNTITVFDADRYTVSDYGVVKFIIGEGGATRYVAVFKLAPGQYIS